MATIAHVITLSIIFALLFLYKKKNNALKSRSEDLKKLKSEHSLLQMEIKSFQRRELLISDILKNIISHNEMLFRYFMLQKDLDLAIEVEDYKRASEIKKESNELKYKIQEIIIEVKKK